MSEKGLSIGLDVGSVSVNLALVDSSGQVVEDRYLRHKGQPGQTVAQALRDLLAKVPLDQIGIVAVTGSGGKLVAKVLGVPFVNEIIAQAKGVEHLHPHIRTIIEIGGEDSKVILLEYRPELETLHINDFAMNTICAAGTGSFLDQQAGRIGLSIEEFGKLALKAKSIPRIAGRCSVFAKTDMIHLQQEATPVPDIVAGLCYALARNFKSTIAKGKKFHKPISFQGGVAANRGMVKAFEDVLGLEPGELHIPSYYASMGAIGATQVIFQQVRGLPSHPVVSGEAGKELKASAPSLLLEGIGRLENYSRLGKAQGHSLQPLSCKTQGPSFPQRDSGKINHPSSQSPSPLFGEERPGPHSSGEEERPALRWGLENIFSKGAIEKSKLDAYIGIDVGSISTNVVVIDSNKALLARTYLMTAGRPIEAVRQGLEKVGREVGHLVNVRGVGTTGSGRYMIGDMVGADVVKNEITAQAVAAVHIDPFVDTIFEIGGQDSKYIGLDDGVVVDFEMNKVCAAGTGSFLEEQAEKLNLHIEEEFGLLALKAQNPIRMGERCTVFMDSDLIHHQQLNASKEDLVAGLSYSIAYNYLNRVVGNKRIGKNVFFQGGVAWNAGVVAAFEQILGQKVTVPPNHDVTGAIGVAIVALEQDRLASSTKGSNEVGSKFKGFQLCQKGYDVEPFECKDCSNCCEIRRVTVEGEHPLFYGSRCGKYDLKKQNSAASACVKKDIPDLFRERENLLENCYPTKAPHPHPIPAEEGKPQEAPPLPFGERVGVKGLPRIGLPRVLIFHELYPFWKAFFTELGFEVVLSDKTTKKIIHQGVENVASETCFPIKLAHGHILNLLEKGLDYIFLPSFINLKQDNPLLKRSFERSFACPYIQSLPYTIKSTINVEADGVKAISPVIYLGWHPRYFQKVLFEIGASLNKSPLQIKEAGELADKAQQNFYERLKARGKEVLEKLNEQDAAIVIVSRPYNGCDQGINLGLPKKLRDMGVLAIPMDYLPLDTVDISREWPNMYWKYGQKILCAAELLRKDQRLNAIYLTNFGCGPDSFITRFFREKMGNKPYLQIEVDEHSADVGAITRCEAFLDSLKNTKRKKVEKERMSGAVAIGRGSDRTLYIPYSSDHAHAICAAMVSNGVPAEVLPESDEKTLEWGRKFTSGKECYPSIITTGDMVKKVKSPGFDPKRSAFFMGGSSGPCRFGQYNVLQRLVLDELGFKEVPIYAPNQAQRFLKDLKTMGYGFVKQAWQGMVAVDLLDKALRQVRPYEKNRGEADAVYNECLQKMLQAMLKKGDLVEVMKESREKFQNVETNCVEGDGQRPVIGLVGEIFVRVNRFSNEDIVRRVESLGAEVWLPPVTEWFLYRNWRRNLHSRARGDYLNILKTFLWNRQQKRQEHRLSKPFEGFLKNLHEPPTLQILDNSKPYLHRSFEGEAILSIGKAVDFVQKGSSGIINVMPFTCMPGTVTNALLRRFHEDYNVPCLNMAYEGLEQTNVQTRLQAFVHQATNFRTRIGSNG